MSLATLITLLQPFKFPKSNMINIVFVNVLTLFALMIIAITSIPYLVPKYSVLVYILMLLFAAVPVIYVIGLVSYWLYSHRVGRRLQTYSQTWSVGEM